MAENEQTDPTAQKPEQKEQTTSESEQTAQKEPTAQKDTKKERAAQKKAQKQETSRLKTNSEIARDEKRAIDDKNALWKCFPNEQPCSIAMCICCHRAIPQRTVMVILSVLGIALAYVHRVCLNLTIVEMTVAKNATENKKYGAEERCTAHGSGHRPVIENIQGGKYDWDEAIQSYLLSSFYMGYLAAHIPLGMLCDRYGTKYIFLVGHAISTICTALIPVVVMYSHWGFVCLLRVISGCSQAPTFVGATEMIGRWIPANEQSRISGVIMSSLSLGTIIGNLPAAYIMKYFRSWTLVFYFYAALSSIWCVFYFFYVYSSPEKHPFITVEEKEYLDSVIVKKVKYWPPFGKIMANLTVWGLMIIQFGHDYCLYTIITNIPKYFNNVLAFTSEMTAILVCLPQVACFATSFIFGITSDHLISRRNIKKVKVRTVYAVFGLLQNCCFSAELRRSSWPEHFQELIPNRISASANMVPPTCLIIMCFVRCTKIVAVGCVVMAMAFKSAFYCSVKVTLIDISRNQAGVISALSNGLGGLAGFVAPLTIGKIAENNTFKEWEIVAFITFAVSFFTLIPYVMFCKGIRADFDYAPNEEKPEFEKGFKTRFVCYKPV